MLEQLFDIAPLSQIMLDKRLLALFKRSFPQGRFIDNLIISQNTDFDVYLSISDLGQFSGLVLQISICIKNPF